MVNKCPTCHSENPVHLKFCGECGTSLTSKRVHPPLATETLQNPPHEIATGSTFAGRYQIIEELGRGGMGRVFKVFDTEVNAKVALKLIRPEISDDPETVGRFRNELKMARDISHKNVCRMYDLGKESGSYFITMEYVAGEDLKSMIHMSGQLGLGTAVSIARQVCEGLAEAHKHGVVHRDLKSSNIMIDREGTAHIMDFGIARSAKVKGITGAGIMIGTPEYMSPEQVEGKEADARSDLYSLGIILYEMVTGCVPFAGDTPISVGVKQKSEPPPDPRQLNPQAPDELVRLILRCLEKDKAKRLQKAEDVLAALEGIERKMPTTLREAPRHPKSLTTREITVKFSLRSVWKPALAIVGLAAIVIVATRLLRREGFLPVPTDKPSLAVMYFKNNTGDAGLDHWRAMLSNALVTDLAQSKHIRVLSEDKLFQILSRLGQEDSQTYSADVLRQVASEGRVNHILQGAYARAGDEFRISVTLQQAGSGDLIGSETVAGKGEASIFSMVDELTRRIKADVKLSPQDIDSDIDREIGIVTTRSPEAYKYYVEGIRHDVKGEYRQEIESLEKAVAIDPDFASAYLAMSWSYANLLRFTEEEKYLEKAMALSDRLTDREKYNIQGHYYGRSETTYHKAVEALEKLLALYPDDISAGNMLAIVYGSMGEKEKAIERYRGCLQAGTEDVVVYRNLAGTYENIGAYDKSIEVQESYINNIGDSAIMRRNLASTYLAFGKRDLALAELDKAIALSPADWSNIRDKGDIYLYMDNLSGAEEEYRKLLAREEGDGRAWGYLKLAGLYDLQARFEEGKEQQRKVIEYGAKLGQRRWLRTFRIYLSYLERRSGHPDAALQELDKAWTSAASDDDFRHQRDILLAQGLTYLEKRSVAEAQDVAARLKAAVDRAPNKKHAWYYHFLTGMIELAKKNNSGAVELLKLGRPLLNTDAEDRFLFADALGTAFYGTGDLENARLEYEKIRSLGTGRLSYGDIYSLSYYWLAKISEKQGKKPEAEGYYRKFLELWINADPGRPEVEDAKRRLAGLQN